MSSSSSTDPYPDTTGYASPDGRNGVRVRNFEEPHELVTVVPHPSASPLKRVGGGEPKAYPSHNKPGSHKNPTYRPPIADFDARIALRNHFVKPLLKALNAIQPHAQTPAAAFYANEILRILRQMQNNLTNDAYVHIATGLYESLVYKNQWACLSAEQYAAAYHALNEAATHNHLDMKHLGKALWELEEAGFDVVPASTEDEENDAEA